MNFLKHYLQCVFFAMIIASVTILLVTIIINFIIWQLPSISDILFISRLIIGIGFFIGNFAAIGSYK